VKDTLSGLTAGIEILLRRSEELCAENAALRARIEELEAENLRLRRGGGGSDRALHQAQSRSQREEAPQASEARVCAAAGAGG